MRYLGYSPSSGISGGDPPFFNGASSASKSITADVFAVPGLCSDELPHNTGTTADYPCSRQALLLMNKVLFETFLKMEATTTKFVPKSYIPLFNAHLATFF